MVTPHQEDDIVLKNIWAAEKSCCTCGAVDQNCPLGRFPCRCPGAWPVKGMNLKSRLPWVFLSKFGFRLGVVRRRAEVEWVPDGARSGSERSPAVSYTFSSNLLPVTNRFLSEPILLIDKDQSADSTLPWTTDSCRDFPIPFFQDQLLTGGKKDMMSTTTWWPPASSRGLAPTQSRRGWIGSRVCEDANPW